MAEGCIDAIPSIRVNLYGDRPTPIATHMGEESGFRHAAALETP
ncbi:hypothetical protein [Austwickia sp. TVS 96-490-7B]|nr:hypothetical protein [Austwickia sp. TVS 96-490-7B]